MTTALRREVAPASEPVSLADVKAHCRIDHSDDDTYIAGLIAAAVAFVDAQGELGRAMITQTWAQYESQAPGRVRLDMGPFIELVSVKFFDAAGSLQTATLADFEIRLHGDFVICKPKEDREWPTADTREDAIKITYTAGYGAASDVPAGIKHALLMLIGHWYENREAVVIGTITATTPMAFAVLIGNERVGWYGS